MKEDLVDEIMQAGPERPSNPVRLEKLALLLSFSLLPVPFASAGGGGGEFPSSSAKVTTWSSPTFSAVNLLRESGGSDNYRPMNSDGHPLSLKEKPNRIAIGLAAKLFKTAKAKNPQNQRRNNARQEFSFLNRNPKL